MNTARLLFPLALTLASGCATTLDASNAARTNNVTANTAHLALEGERAVQADAAGACFVSGAGRTIAPKALVRPGIELVSIESGLALGFKSARHEAVALSIDPSPAMTLGSLSKLSADAIRTVTSIDRTLWHLSDEPVKDLQAIALSNGGYAVAFRQGDALFLGRMDADKNPVGPLRSLAERPNLRTPTLAEAGDDVLVVWSEATPQDRWSLAGVSVAPCGHTTAIRLDLPMESADGDAIHPALAKVDSGHLLLVWTEGRTANHQVRAITLEATGRAVGPVLQVSSGAESGWGRPAFTADGRGAVVYLVPSDSGFAIAATPIACPLAGARPQAVISTRL